MIKYQQKKGRRIKNFKFLWVDIKGYHMLLPNKIWVDNDTFYENKAVLPKYQYSSSGSHPIRSLRAFRRNLRKWSKYLPKGTKVLLISRYIGFNVYATI